VFEATRRLLETADRYYASGDVGIRRLDLRCAWAVTTARDVYREIGRVVLARREKAWDERAIVGGGRKIRLAARALAKAALAVSRGRHAPAPPRENLWTQG
jgi:phytoene synthase